VNKAQNPNNNFYFNTQKCIGSTAHSIQDQNMKKKKYEISFYFIESEEKGILGCSKKNSSVLYKVKHLLYKLKNA